jgi:hypothetical protein
MLQAINRHRVKEFDTPRGSPILGESESSKGTNDRSEAGHGGSARGAIAVAGYARPIQSGLG